MKSINTFKKENIFLFTKRIVPKVHLHDVFVIGEYILVTQ